ncbi:glycosyltransferase [Candidatus Microgenomates bacterium]|nr:MAG: glycosyltransferase [Candidatus Microgenomates bacterium]
MISFIIPVYNKGAILFKTLTSLLEHLSQHSITDFEIILVNDGSTDNSFLEAKRFKNLQAQQNNIHLYHYSKNIGKGFALKFGFYKSCGETVVFLDGDMDIDTSQIIAALNTFTLQKPDMVIGSKYHRASRIHYPVNRYLYSLVLKAGTAALFNLEVTDSQVGMKIFKREVLQSIFPRLIIKRFAVDLELLVVAHMLGFTRIVEVPVIINHTSANQSSVNVWAVKNFLQDMAAIFYRKSILRFYEKQHFTSFNFSLLSFEIA